MTNSNNIIYELSTKIGFGMHKGKTIKQIVDESGKGYNWVAWALKNIKGFKLSDKAFSYCKKKGKYWAVERDCSIRDGMSQSMFYRKTGLSGGPSGEYAQSSMDEGMSRDINELLCGGDNFGDQD